MDRIKQLSFALPICILLGFAYGCQSSSPTSKVMVSDSSKTTQKPAPKKLTDIKYVFHYKVINSAESPNDDMFVDSTGQMTFSTDQKLKSGQLKNPTGFAYLEPSDDDTLYYFIRQSALMDIDPGDVKPQCPTGDVLIITLYRCDLRKWLKLETNTCAVDFNLLSSGQRKLFQQFIPFIRRLAARYRPGFLDN
jgi:hypothetical protein